VQGALKRDERELRSTSRDAFVQARCRPHARLDRHRRCACQPRRLPAPDDLFINPGTPDNGDDSGQHRATAPPTRCSGMSWRAAESLNLYANAGQGFETPTFTELSYRPAPASA
jgi:iron complex outermembrane receptor protein